ncbi:Tetracycline resistance protein from transposon [Coniochaeta hoffmannii]|uniref:Tetracycline resistance protein from transposon n=1 Tax=Coniochaeta hoffmannii TaxID=91930 RepID=A0AA38S248_9PEZI|nr:Tetracycline resistance protein from transposon [Coniochaeta hoffmannii]
MDPLPKIAIIGAGPAGCTLARLLHLSSIPCTIFEAEPAPDYRSQGGSLDLHTDTGLAALRKAGLFDQFLAKARYDGDYNQFTDKDLKVYLERAGPQRPDNKKAPSSSSSSGWQQERPEIDRPDLRRILTESLPEGTIAWGRKLARVEADDGDKHRLVFSDGAESSAGGWDLVVGADGAWSRVRALLSDRQPVFSGVGGFELSVSDGAARAPGVHAAARGGTIFAFDEGKEMCMQQMGDGSLTVHASTVKEGADWADRCGFDPADLEATKAYLLGEESPFADWCEPFRDAIRLADGRCTARSLYMLPVGFRWTHRRGVTVLGDAAHLMTYFAGEGVNVALKDAMVLAEEIAKAVKKGGDMAERLDDAVRDFELEMWPRSEKVARLSHDLMKAWMFTPGVPRSVIASTSVMHVKFHTPWVLHPLAVAAVHSYFWLKGRTG